jgi:hypothetical protein
MRKFWLVGLVTLIPIFVLAQVAAPTSVSLADWVGLLITTLKDFIMSGVTWQVKVAAVIALLISSMKVSFLQGLWAKLGDFQIWLAPILGLVAGIISVLSGGTWTDVLGYVAAGGGAVFIHELLDIVKIIPGLGPMWTGLIDIIEKIPVVGANGTAIDPSNLLSISDGILNGVTAVAAQAIWAEVLVAVPWLTLPIIGPIVSWIYFKLVSFLNVNSIKFANWFILGYQVAAQKQVYDTAVSKLQAALANAQGDPSGLQQASSDFDNALAGLVHSDLPGGPAQ